MSAKQKFWIILDEKGTPTYTGTPHTMYVFFNRPYAERYRIELQEFSPKKTYRIKEAFVNYKD